MTTKSELPQKSLHGTKTEVNLVNSYLAESTAYTRYMFYSKKAEDEKYYPIAKIFQETADNEMHHAKVFFKMLEGGVVESSNLAVDAGVIGTTEQNLATAAYEELVEGVEMYTNAAIVAEEEGFPEIASHFRAIATIEDHHRRRFERYLEQVKAGTVWKRDHSVLWQCLVCGYIFEGNEPPVECPACDHPREHYMALDIYLD